MTRDHEKYAPLLDAFIDAELPEERMTEIGFHVAECPDCQRYLRDAEKIREAFPVVEDTVVPEGFAESVMTALPVRKGAYENMENNNNYPESRNEYNPADEVHTDAQGNQASQASQGNQASHANAPENADGGDHANTPGVGGNNPDSQNGQRNWRTIAMALAACLVVVVVVQVSGVLNPGRDGAVEGVGAAMSQSSGSGANDDAASGDTEAEEAETADVPEESSSAPEDTADTAALNEAVVTESDINTQDSADAADGNANEESTAPEENEDNNPTEDESAAKVVESTDADSGTDVGYTVTARNAEVAQSEPEADLRVGANAGEPESILNGLTGADSGDNAAEEENTDNSPDYEAALTLPADAAPILSVFEPLETVSNGVWYAFSHDDYAALLEQLDGAGFVGNDIRIPREDIIYVFVES